MGQPAQNITKMPTDSGCTVTLEQAIGAEMAFAAAAAGPTGRMRMLWWAMAAAALACRMAEAQGPAPAPTPAAAPAPAPAPPFVNVTQVVAQAGKYTTFANLIVETKVDEVFQRNANATQVGIAIFAPEDDAFTDNMTASMISTLNDSQKTSLVLYHALNNWVSLATLQLTHDNQTATLATYNNGGGRYLLNLTSQLGVVQILSAWTTANLTSTLYSLDPISVFGINAVLLPEDLFGLPTAAPAPAPSSGGPTPTPSSVSPSLPSAPGPLGSGGFRSVAVPSLCISFAIVLALVMF